MQLGPIELVRPVPGYSNNPWRCCSVVFELGYNLEFWTAIANFDILLRAHRAAKDDILNEQILLQLWEERSKLLTEVTRFEEGYYNKGSLFDPLSKD